MQTLFLKSMLKLLADEKLELYKRTHDNGFLIYAYYSGHEITYSSWQDKRLLFLHHGRFGGDPGPTEITNKEEQKLFDKFIKKAKPWAKEYDNDRMVMEEIIYDVETAEWEAQKND